VFDEIPERIVLAVFTVLLVPFHAYFLFHEKYPTRIYGFLNYGGTVVSIPEYIG
jgi:hypothetical protein